MFTGIIEEIGSVLAVRRDPGTAPDAARSSDNETSTPAPDAQISVRGPIVTSDVSLGDSISVNGVCLTVTSFDDGTFTADVMPETMDRSTLGELVVGAKVNLERAVAVGDRLGGHIVQGHVDETTTLRKRTQGVRWDELVFDLSRAIAPLVATKGSITIDGVSLTVSSVTDTTFTVSLIPTTLEHTTLGSRSPGDQVNLETDIIARHVARLKEWDR